MDVITSAHNPVVRETKSLKLRKNRDDKGLFFIEGLRFVEEALKGQVHIIRVVLSEDFIKTKGEEGIVHEVMSGRYETCVVTNQIFREMSDTENPQGILAVVKKSVYTFDDLLAANNFIIILESVQDPGNLGTIIRTADAAGVTGIVLSKGCVDLYNPKVLRATMGSVFHVPVYSSGSIIDTIRRLQSKGVKVYAAHLKGETQYFDVDMRNDTALIIGNEANGISDEVASLADTLVKIPMPGQSESLNASIAAGLLMYEVVRQRLAE